MRDGDLDLAVGSIANGNTPAPNELYLNVGGVLRKDPVWVSADANYAASLAWGDVDGDGDLDLLVTALGGPNACFLNDGAGKFADFTKESGLAANTGATTMALSWIAPEEWHDLLGRAGFEVEGVYGWFDRRPYRGGEDTVWIARRPE